MIPIPAVRQPVSRPMHIKVRIGCGWDESCVSSRRAGYGVAQPVAQGAKDKVLVVQLLWRDSQGQSRLLWEYRPPQNRAGVWDKYKK